MDKRCVYTSVYMYIYIYMVYMQTHANTTVPQNSPWHLAVFSCRICGVPLRRTVFELAHADTGRTMFRCLPDEQGPCEWKTGTVADSLVDLVVLNKIK